MKLKERSRFEGSENPEISHPNRYLQLKHCRRICKKEFKIKIRARGMKGSTDNSMPVVFSGALLITSVLFSNKKAHGTRFKNLCFDNSF